MTEGTPAEGQQPLTKGRVLQLNRSLTEKVLARAESDPKWKELLLDDPELAMREANFPELKQLAQQGPPRSPAEREVVGQITDYGWSQADSCPLTCRHWTYYWDLSVYNVGYSTRYC